MTSPVEPSQNCLDTKRPLRPELRNRTFLMRVVQVGAGVTVLKKALRIPSWDDRALWDDIGGRSFVADELLATNSGTSFGIR